MATKYIIRMDDACPQMDKKKWGRMEEILTSYNVKPLVALVPNNEDPSLMIEDADPDFWGKAVAWQNMGWDLALHGCNHVYAAKGKSIIPLKNVSEFSGLSINEQYDKIKEGIEIFKKHKITTNIFVAPGHAFDELTIRALQRQGEISIISDGFFLQPVKYLQFNWIPQQLWKPRKMLTGLWTICYHPNTMNDQDFTDLEVFLKANHKDFISVRSITNFKEIGLINRSFSALFYAILKFKQYLNNNTR